MVKRKAQYNEIRDLTPTTPSFEQDEISSPISMKRPSSQELALPLIF